MSADQLDIDDGGNGKDRYARTAADGTVMFVKGCPGGPGRPVGLKTGRQATLATLDRMLAKAENQKRLEEDLQRLFDTNPARFMLMFVYPILPKDLRVNADEEMRMMRRAFHAALVRVSQPGATEGGGNGGSADPVGS